ncbi:transporter family protein [Pseudarcicella hirudinis]|uniref:Transporter family protein n=1 Tax=Pseudarcicella hirudinis TaxID=1079859 RepID=A0A1I5WEF3_9BACT|nr:EamA family transporter [Pseudarcicella hirudinis]SFQ18164.1 transporter family protein [Pseudarcicella hirudinis]
MPQWLIYALLSTLFAGLTSVLAKFGISKINSDFGLAIRTSVVFLLVWLNTISWHGLKDFANLTPKSVLFLALSGVTTSLSWIFYYRAMKMGTVSYVAAIDKGSILITILLSFTLLKEPLTPKLLIGAGFILIGMIVLIWK